MPSKRSCCSDERGVSSPAELADALSADGPLSRSLAGFAPRAAQQAMAEQVASAIDHGDTLIVEAATGTGKTLAYLVPALLSGKRTIISTGTKALQDQLFERDLPAVRDALATGGRIARLKGRSNYLCIYRLEQALDDGSLPQAVQRGLQIIRRWSGRTEDGDLVGVTGLPDEAPARAHATSTADNCLGQRCPRYDDCWVMHARRKAQEADIVVVNHHLLFADLALKDTGFAELLPGADTVIVDEAHQVPEIAAGFFGFSVSTRQLHELVADAKRESRAAQAGGEDLAQALDQLSDDTDALTRRIPRQVGRLGWDAVFDDAGARQALDAVSAALAAVQDALGEVAMHSEGLSALHQRAMQHAARLESLCAGETEAHVRWVDVLRSGFALQSTPLIVAERFRSSREREPSAWIFSSATLAVDGQFTHFARQIGAEQARTQALDSPFDFHKQARLLLPDMPNPNTPEFRQAVVELAQRLITASNGGAFLLCTSHAAVRHYADALDAVVDAQVLHQGQAPKAALLEAFRMDGNAVLVATQSFWEGVDVPGRALRLVMIDRLPFAAPGDPVLRARAEQLKAQGLDPFRDYQVPAAAVTLKQGAGRLIRGHADRGLLVICDPRLATAGYGRTLRAALPDMPVIKDVAEACDFLREAVA